MAFSRTPPRFAFRRRPGIRRRLGLGIECHPLHSAGMERPKQFEEHRWVGDKRSQIVYDVDRLEDESLIAELVEAGTYLCFGPDTLAEARNRGYRPYKGNGHGAE